MEDTAKAKEVADVAEKYYDSDDADNFYFNIWGGEDIHVGLYWGEDDSIFEASRRTVERMASKVKLTPETRVLDLGAGYGGAGRYLAKTYGCHVACVNISETQNQRNREMNREQGLDDKVEVIHGNFEELPAKDHSYDVIWSQDSFLHSGNRKKVLEEVRRVIRPSGEFIFTDPMQADDCPAGVLQPVLDRIHLDSLGSFAFYRQALKELGFVEVEIDDLSQQLTNHYASVRKRLQSRYDEMKDLSSQTYLDRMIQGLGHWVEAGTKGYLAWGILHFRAG